MVTVRADPNDSSKVEIFLKGAPEFVINSCTLCFSEEGWPIKFDGTSVLKKAIE